MTQFLPSFVWKVIYANYKANYPHSPLQEDTLKDQFQNILKEFKIRISNVERNKKVMLQNEEALAY